MTMRTQLRPALVTFVLLTVLTGLVYPLAVTGIAQAAMPDAANGSLIKGNDASLVGSSLIGQNFTDPRYLWGRPSATAGAPYTAYDAKAQTGSSGSNLGPFSADLREVAEERIAVLRSADPGNPAPIPVDLVTASASGLDPDISMPGALYQAARVARARGIDEATVRGLIARQTQDRFLGLFGEPRVNVLALNLALDKLQEGVE